MEHQIFQNPIFLSGQSNFFAVKLGAFGLRIHPQAVQNRVLRHLDKLSPQQITHLVKTLVLGQVLGLSWHLPCRTSNAGNSLTWLDVSGKMERVRKAKNFEGILDHK